MKKILFLITVLMLSLTPLISQNTITLNTVNDFSDFTISGTQNTPPVFMVTPAVQGSSPLSFTLCTGGMSQAYKEVSNTYTSSVIFDSIVAKFDIFSPIPFRYNSVLVGSGQTTEYIRITNSSNISVTFSLSSQVTSSNGPTVVKNLTVIGYKNGSSTGIKESLDLTKTVIYPNPTNDLINIKSDNEIGLISILNYTGEVIYNSECNSKDFQISLLNQSKGVYFIKTKNQSFKLIKN